MLTVAKVLEAFGMSSGGLTYDSLVSGACVDSRKVCPGSLFIALPGENNDGHNFVDAAFKNGAVMALVEHEIESAYPIYRLGEAIENHGTTPFSLLIPNTLTGLQEVAAWWRKQFELPVIGITGSVGKSSTKETLAGILGAKFNVLKNQANLNNEIGLPLTLLSLNENHQVAVLEMGFYVPGEIDLLCQIALPEIGVITNIGTVHAERAGDIETIARGKSELLQALPSTGLAVLNYDDEQVRVMTDKTAARVVSYGLNPEAELWADEIESLGLDGIRFKVHFEGKSHKLSSKLLGKHSVYNLLASFAVALELGMNWDEIENALHTEDILQRVRIFEHKSGAQIIDDSYNASPASTIAALDLLESLNGFKIAVLGDMLELGQYETEGHQEVGRKAAEVANQIILVGPRSKITAEAIYSHASSANLPISWFYSSTEAAEFLQSLLSTGQTVLVKGSHGMRMDKIIVALEEKN